jgi:Flp pilus assembly CpaF family ATPase
VTIVAHGHRRWSHPRSSSCTPQAQRKTHVQAINAHELIVGGLTPPTAEEESTLQLSVFNLLFGLGRLQPHLERTDVVNVHAAGAEPVWLDLLDGTTIRGTPVADSDEELIEFVRQLGRRVGLSERLFDPAHPRINLQLPDGSSPETLATGSSGRRENGGLLSAGESHTPPICPTGGSMQ